MEYTKDYLKGMIAECKAIRELFVKAGAIDVPLFLPIVQSLLSRQSKYQDLLIEILKAELADLQEKEKQKAPAD